MSICLFSRYQNRCSSALYCGWCWNYFPEVGLSFILFSCSAAHASGVINFFILETCIMCWSNLCVWPVLQTIITFEPSSVPKGNRFPVFFRDSSAEVELWRSGLLFFFKSFKKLLGAAGPGAVIGTCACDYSNGGRSFSHQVPPFQETRQLCIVCRAGKRAFGWKLSPEALAACVQLIVCLPIQAGHCNKFR